MNKKIFFLVVAILMGSMTAVKAKINYVPLYIVDTQPDVKVTKHTPSMPLFITQDDHRLTLPELGDSLTLIVLKNNKSVHVESLQRCQPAVCLPATLVGDYEVRLNADTYYYYGYITLESHEELNIPSETDLWENITLLGNNTTQQVILDNVMGLHAVEYNMKPLYEVDDTLLSHLSGKEREEYIKHINEKNAELCAQLRFGLLPEELREMFPQVVRNLQDGTVGINYTDLIPVLVCCIQELKTQLDSRTEKIVDIMTSRGTSPSAVREVRSAIGNTLLSAAPTSVNEPALVRYLLADDAANACISITDMGGRVMTRVPVSPANTSVSIDSGLLGEGVYLCTLVVNGENIATKRLVKTK